MNSVLLKLVVTVLAVLYVADYSQGAAVRSEEFAEQLSRIVQEENPDSLRTQRATKIGDDDKPLRNCYDEPCGWNSYNPVTRRGSIFMPNTCKCPDKSFRCIRTGENISMNAYVYHCRQNTTADDIEGRSPYTMDQADYIS
ncbi:uncharacterized protein LOC116432146 [Nomia melanderi]|uniref:uncharacterized protein LOC116432146 n=1 Tax=Nomia melanderi TaxID=2448451 RepID=UPI001303F742|nr:uncharacterized protein LOC116432146 [Nomia melanderi]